MVSETTVLNLEGRRVSESLIHEFGTRLRGRLLRPGTDGYEESRKIWNSNALKHPSLIARCGGVEDVISCVKFARENELLTSIKGGGHSIAGLGLCEGGLTIDLTGFKGVTVDPVERTARAGTGVTWGEFDHETQLHGLATTGGEVSTTGISGLTLGGGIGWLLGTFGTSCDNLVSADVVTADGSFLTADADRNSDLFWALRGGGGNFGVVTSFTYKLHPVGRVLGGFVGWPTTETEEVLEFLEDFVEDLPDEVGKIGAEVITTRDGRPIVIVRPGYIGSIDEGERLLSPLKRIAKTLYDNMRPMSYEALQTQRDAYWPWGRQNYFKSGFVDNLSDDFIKVYRAHTKDVPSPHSQIAVEYYHGAYCRARTDETAYPHRQKAWSLAIGASWVDPSQSERNIRWARAFWKDVEPLASGGVYVNFMSEGEDDRIAIAYGKNYSRLVSIKNRYDPTNLFRVNENIKPSVASY